MISTIIWDRAANKLILSRDPSGVKPLFYHVSADRVAVGSEIKALFADDATPRTVDWETSLAATSLHGTPLLTLDRARTWFTDVRMVQAGTTVEIDLTSGDITIHEYWHPQLIMPDTETSRVERHRTVPTRSVRENREADADGLCSAVASTGPRLDRTRWRLTVLSGSTAANGDAEFAHEAALRLGHRNHQILVPDAHTPGLDEWLRFLCLMETPLAGMEAYLKYLAYVGAKTVNPNLRGMMIGTGADEFAGGYAGELAQGEGWDGFTRALESLVRATARSAGLGVFHWTDRDDIVDLVSCDAVTPASMNDAHAAFVIRKFLDVEQYNTWVEDRAASGSSVEGRVPFLDRELVELAISVPAHLRRELLWDKAMLRAATRGIVPERLRTREKQPFFHGVHENHAFDIAIRMLKANNYEMVRAACAGCRPMLFTADSAVQFTRGVERRPSHTAIEYPFRPVNPRPGPDGAHTRPVCRRRSRAAGRRDRHVRRDVGRSSPIAAQRTRARSDAFTRRRGVRGRWSRTDAALIYIARHGEFDMVIDEDVAAWSQLLPVLGTQQTRKSLVDLTGLDDDVVYRLLSDGLGAGFVFAGHPREDS
jgi:asparagine synthase (glutamine-hydrolysing)